MDNYDYTDERGTFNTNQYVNINVIYDITKSIFGKSDFLVLNKYLTTDNDMIPLLLIDDDQFLMSIEKVVDIKEENGNYEVKIKYQYLDIIYKYSYTKTSDNRLALYNLEIEMNAYE